MCHIIAKPCFLIILGDKYRTKSDPFSDPHGCPKIEYDSGASALWQAKNTLEFPGYQRTQTLKTQIG